MKLSSRPFYLLQLYLYRIFNFTLFYFYDKFRGVSTEIYANITLLKQDLLSLKLIRQFDGHNLDVFSEKKLFDSIFKSNCCCQYIVHFKCQIQNLLLTLRPRSQSVPPILLFNETNICGALLWHSRGRGYSKKAYVVINIARNLVAQYPSLNKTKIWINNIYT